jgi:hypothetical protein
MAQLTVYGLGRINKTYRIEGWNECLSLCFCHAFSPYLQIFANNPIENEVFSGPGPANSQGLTLRIALRILTRSNAQ